MKKDNDIKTIIMDVTETQTERSKRGQKGIASLRDNMQIFANLKKYLLTANCAARSACAPA